MISKNHHSFLLIRLSSLGDILLLTPALRALRQTFPNARLDVLIRSRYRELLADNPHISGLVLFEDFPEPTRLRRHLHGQYKTVIDLHTSLRSCLLRRRLGAPQVLTYHKRRCVRWIMVNFKQNLYGGEFSLPLAYMQALAPLQVQDDGGGLEWPGALARREEFLRLADLEAVPDPGPVALCPGASYETKRWPREYWRELAGRLLDRDCTLWIFGDEQDIPAGENLRAINPARVVNFCGKLSLAQTGAGLSFCRLAITHDAGPAHMAAAVQVPVVDIFGSTVPQFGFRPFRVPHRLVEAAVLCRPCSHLGYDACPLGHFRCMKEISVEHVLKLVCEIWDESQR